MPHGVMGDLMADDQCQFISGPYKMQQARRHDDLPAIGVRVHSVLVPQPYGVWTAAYAGDRERTFRAVLLDHDVERRRARAPAFSRSSIAARALLPSMLSPLSATTRAPALTPAAAAGK